MVVPKDAHAVRFALGLASGLTPLVIDDANPNSVRFGLRPVLDVEALPWLAFEAYAPFTLIRTGDNIGAASSGAESVFGVGVSGRYRLVRAIAPEEHLFYGKARGGFTTVNGRAGPFYGFAAGYAVTWLGTGRGVFAELEASHADISARSGDLGLDRWLLGVSIGLVFRLGGETWDVARRP